jgi:hypothetical protein
MPRKHIILVSVIGITLGGCSSTLTAPSTQLRPPRAAAADEVPVPSPPPPQTSAAGGNAFGSGT